MTYSFIPSYVLGALIFIVASLPGSDIHEVQQYPDNLFIRFLISDQFMHFATFGVLAFLIYFAYERSCIMQRASQKVKDKSLKADVGYFIPGLSGIGYGLFIELYQGILPWRAFGFDDLFWNVIGVLFATAVFYFIPLMPNRLTKG